MPDTWELVERWNAARDSARGNLAALALLSRHTVWVMESIELRFHCYTCMKPWPCVVFTELETVLREVGK